MDSDPIEQQRGISIVSAVTRADWKDHVFNLIDTPGHVDFTVEVERSLRVLDGAVAVFCAVGGVEPQSETVWRQADKYKVPRLAFINKMDRVGSDFFGVVQEIKDKLGSNPVPMQIPIGSEENFKGIVDLIERRAIVWKEDAEMGMKYEYCDIPEDLIDTVEEWREKLVEAVCVSDDDLLNKFLEDRDSISVEEFMSYARRATINMDIVPVLCGSAFKNKGVQRLLDAITDLLPFASNVDPYPARMAAAITAFVAVCWLASRRQEWRSSACQPTRQRVWVSVLLEQQTRPLPRF